ncbi:zinc finger dna-binding protein [Ophiostoma piceae UAMH 11346]|uniref:Zinc finger dna-binding protein n=1 Tax=Ophiostoma piceae (strain UAMH 11346) TaxID=1262450 RepID=S3CQP9_OPHP1|nr:zinc finger dna-binding protein [Ophiostoma piceae UAMH 11346]
MPDIQYYVVRQGEAQERFVPMIPVDQLPDWLDVVGVPRELQAKDATKMTALLDIGRKGGLGGTFQVRLLMDGPGEASSESDAGTGQAVKPAALTASLAASSETSVTSAPSSHDATGGEACDTHLDPIKELTDKNEDPGCWKHACQPAKPIMAKGVPKTTADSKIQNPAKGESQNNKLRVLPCKYWCKYGRCGFNTRCQFAHIMPLTREGLQAVDLDELPKWFIKKQSSGQDPDKKKDLPAGRQSSSFHGGTPTARSKLYKTQKATAATASYTTNRQSTMCTPALSKTYKHKTVITADTARAVEVDDLIELI